MANILTQLKIGTRIYALTAILAVGMALVLYLGISNIEAVLWKAYAERTQSVMDTADTLIKEYQERAAKGEFSTEEAKARALKRLSSIRYDGQNYFWVNNMDGIMLMHPTSPKLIGTDVRDLKDADGKKIFSDMIDIVKKEGHRKYVYQWPPDATAKPKMSYVVGVPAWGWLIGTGVFADKIRTDVIDVGTHLGAVAGGVLLLGILLALVIGRGISKPIEKITSVMKRLADGDLDVKIGLNDRHDEIGDMAVAVTVFQDNARQVSKLKQEQEEIEKRAAAEKKAMMEKLASDFEQSVGGIVSIVASAATQLQSSSKNLTELSDQTSRQTSTVAAATEEASSSIQTVASAAEELSASIGEINRQVDDSSAVAASAVTEVKKTDATVSTLSEAATQIGDVVKLIQDIAEQTNLLALNATIEAARAGEAGKGFAVVASEVKNLANQTAKATEEISKKIDTVQSVSKDSVSAIRTIGGIIEHIDEITKTIANALGQQDAATREISNNVQQASAGTSEISSSIVNVTHAAMESRNAASDVHEAASELSKQSESLRKEVQNFVHKIRNS